MTIRGKLLSNSIVAVTGILLISVAALTGIYNVKQRVFDVTGSSTPRQLQALEFTKALSEHGALLSVAIGAQSESELAKNERELGLSLSRLKVVASKLRSLTTWQNLSAIDETVGEVEGLTHQIVGSTMERIHAEQRTAQSRAEAQELIRLNAQNRMALQSSLKAIQASSVSELRRSSAKTKEMTAQFRALQVAKDSFQQIESAMNDLRTIPRAEDVPVIRGRVAFAIHNFKPTVPDTGRIAQSLLSFEKMVFDEKGVLSLKSAQLTDPSGSSQNLFDDSWKLCRVRLDELARLIDENSVDTTMAFYSENSQLEQRLADSDAVGKIMLLNTELSTYTDAIQNAVQVPGHERDPGRIRGSADSMRQLFATSKGIINQLGMTLGTAGGEDGLKVIRETGSMLDRVERLVVKDGGIIETLEAAARTQDRSEQMEARLAGMIQTQKNVGDRIVSDARAEQSRTVGTVNFVVKAVTVLLIGAIGLVLCVTAFLNRCIGRSIVDLVEDLKTAKEDAEAASKAKSQFLANMSHEIRTPMNGVLGLLELLKASSLKEKQREYVKMALSSSVSLLNVINDVLDFSKMEAGRLELVIEDLDLLKTTEDALALFSEQAEAKGIEIFCHVLSGTPHRLRGDAARLRQILINLIGNAVELHGKGRSDSQGPNRDDRVRLGSPSIRGKGYRHRYSSGSTGTDLRFVLTGRLVDYPQIRRNRTRLKYSDPACPHDGRRDGVESDPGKGSTFWFTAQFATSTEVKNVEKSVEGEGARKGLKGLKVLVVDDNSTNRAILNDMLLAWGLVPGALQTGRKRSAYSARPKPRTPVFISLSSI